MSWDFPVAMAGSNAYNKVEKEGVKSQGVRMEPSKLARVALNCVVVVICQAVLVASLLLMAYTVVELYGLFHMLRLWLFREVVRTWFRARPWW